MGSVLGLGALHAPLDRTTAFVPLWTRGPSGPGLAVADTIPVRDRQVIPTSNYQTER
jgi:hypothetical protein